jgi:hypothetical protein
VRALVPIWPSPAAFVVLDRAIDRNRDIVAFNNALRCSLTKYKTFMQSCFVRNAKECQEARYLTPDTTRRCESIIPLACHDSTFLQRAYPVLAKGVGPP